MSCVVDWEPLCGSLGPLCGRLGTTVCGSLGPLCGPKAYAALVH